MIVLAVTAAILGAATTHAATGPYLDFGSHPDFVDNKVVTIGAEGVPVVHYSWGVEDNPVIVCHWALQHWSRWLTTGAADDLDPVITAADWLVGRQRDDGAWTYSFDFNALGVPMRPPWISAMSQGMGISVLVRAHEATGDDTYLQAALLALLPFSKMVADGGVVTDWSGVPWYEEYPGDQSQHVLNGFEFALLGLYDLADRSDAARDMWNAGVASLVARIGLYDVPSARTQLYAALNGGRLPVTRDSGYQHWHAILTRTLATLTGEQTLADYANRWEQYERQPATVTAPAPAPPAITAPAPAPVDATAPDISMRLKSTYPLEPIRRNGLTVRLTCSEACVVKLTLQMRAGARLGRGIPAAHRLVVVGRAKARLSMSGAMKVRIRLNARTRRALRSVGRVRLTVQAAANDVTGNTRVVTRHVTLKRRIKT